MSGKIDPASVFQRLERLEQENRNREQQSNALKAGGGGGTSDGMDLTSYRMDQYEKRADAADAKMSRVEDKLTAIQLLLAGHATKDFIRNWNLAVIAIVLASIAGMGAIMLQSSGNQLSAFQAGLSSVQAIVAAAQTGQQSAAPAAQTGQVTARPAAQTGQQPAAPAAAPPERR